MLHPPQPPASMPAQHHVQGHSPHQHRPPLPTTPSISSSPHKASNCPQHPPTFRAIARTSVAPCPSARRMRDKLLRTTLRPKLFVGNRGSMMLRQRTMKPRPPVSALLLVISAVKRARESARRLSHCSSVCWGARDASTAAHRCQHTNSNNPLLSLRVTHTITMSNQNQQGHRTRQRQVEHPTHTALH
jgi:hypothetical protein